MRRPLILCVLLVCSVVFVPAEAHATRSQYTGPPMPATVPLINYVTRQEATLEPDSLYVEDIYPGASFTEDKMLFIPASVTPSKGDVLICFDLTASMNQELNNVKNNSVNIMNAVRALIPDTNFGVISHMDYDGVHSGCGYSATYGLASDGDYDYSLDQPLTDDTGVVTTAINALGNTDGWDLPEDYSRALYETYSDPGIGWRDGAKKIVLQWGDNVPHDCEWDACLGGQQTYGPDPGRDGVDNNADDLEILNVLFGMAAADITLLPLHSGQYLTLWDCYAFITGGQAFFINYDGTIPGGSNIADFIASIIGLEIGEEIEYMTLEVCTPGYEAWLTNVVPAGYSNIVLDEDHYLPFEITITVPMNVEEGLYCFDICAMGDDVEYARQHVCVDVAGPVPAERSSWGKIKHEYK
jgi:hypothetical protein